MRNKKMLGLVFGSLVMFGCTTFNMYDSEVSIKDSAIVQYSARGREVITEIHDLTKNRIIEIDAFLGKHTVVLPAGDYIFLDGWRGGVIGRTYSGDVYREYYYRSERVTLEAGKHYTLTKRDDSYEYVRVSGIQTTSKVYGTIVVTEQDGRGKRPSGVKVFLKSGGILNAFGWRYNRDLLLGEAGPRLGFMIFSDLLVMDITGEATIGWGLIRFNSSGEPIGTGFPYRYGGSITAYFDYFSIGLGVGITGHTFGISNSTFIPAQQLSHVPYVQLKLNILVDNFGDRVNHFIGPGIFFDYYPTVKPLDMGAFGFGITVKM